MQSYKFDHYTMGVCYYPEHWPKTLWEEDLDRMKKAGISAVRVGEFAWNLFEPEEGSFTFAFFDEFFSLCQEKGMKIILGTPSATPPAWLTEKYPEALNAKEDGTLYRHGGRRHYTYNSPVYRRLVSRIVEKMAQHYGPHPALIGWQIDNELNCETNEFYSEADSQAFRVFVKEKYGTLEELNRAWGTVFWNQTYTGWEQVFVPRPVINQSTNPHLLLDYYRFISASARSFCSMQAEIIRRYTKPEDFITTNGMFGNLDNHRMTEESLDIYMYDSYPSFAFILGTDPINSRNLNDRHWTRNLIEVRWVCPHFGIMEQQSGACGWTSRMEGPVPRPGQLKLWAMQSVAQGADYVSFFRWRTAVFGTEMYWHGILDYDSRDNRKLAEVEEFGRYLKKIDPVCGAEAVTSFALVKDYDNEWDAQADRWHSRMLRQSNEEIFCAGELTHTPYDVLYLNDDTSKDCLKKYPVLIYPHPLLMNERRTELLKTYVENGGTLILGCRSGLKDMDGHMTMLPQPGLLQELTGTDVKEFSFVSPAEGEVRLDWAGVSYEAPVFNDVLTPLEGTKVLARFATGFYAGEPAVTEHGLGKGRVIHCGFAFSRELVKALLAHTGIIEPFAEEICAPENVQVVLRQKGKAKYYFVLNYMPHEETIELKRELTDMLSGEKCSGKRALKPYEVIVLCTEE